MSIQTKCALRIPNYPIPSLEHPVAELAVRSRAHFNSLPTALYTRIFVFLDLSDISHSGVNKRIHNATLSPSLYAEKLRSMDFTQYDELRTLASLGIQVEWRQSLRELLAISNINRRIKRARSDLHGLLIDQAPITYQANQNYNFCVVILKIIVKSPYTTFVKISRNATNLINVIRNAL